MFFNMKQPNKFNINLRPMKIKTQKIIEYEI